jgi:hypothetical protein
VVAGEVDQRERYHLMQHTYWRSREDDDGFEEQLAAYRKDED